MTDKKNLTLTEAFNVKNTQNGDVAFSVASTNNMVNLMFMSEYYQNHLDEVHIGDSDRERLFAMFMRDPRYGLGRRDLGRHMMGLSGCSINDVVAAGRADDLFEMPTYGNMSMEDVLDWCRYEIERGNELVKKWMPRYSSKDKMFARMIAKYYGMTKQEYGHFIKCDTVESKLSRKDTDSIVFEHVPSQAMLKYASRFKRCSDTAERFAKYIDDVKAGKVDLKVSTTTVYDIYKNRDKIDPDVVFDKIEKISGSWIPVVDTSDSMVTCNAMDAFGKAMAIGHYLAKCSTYAPNKVITFSSMPILLELGRETIPPRLLASRLAMLKRMVKLEGDSTYIKEMRSMVTGDCSNTDFGAVMATLSSLGEFPEYIVVLSDMEFDRGSRTSKNELEDIWKANGIDTKIIWWNLSASTATAPECDERGNIFMSGYSPKLLKYLESGFDASAFLDKLLDEYAKKICINK